MTSKDYKEIQDAQIRYETYVQGRRFDLIVSELLSEEEDVSLVQETLGINEQGRSRVVSAFETVGVKFEANGGFLLSDLSTSEVIEFDPDGNKAVGTWLTIGFRNEKNEADDHYSFYRVFGQRNVRFVKEKGAWKMKDITWKKTCEIGPCDFDISKDTGWIGLRERRWELPPSSEPVEWEGRRAK